MSIISRAVASGQEIEPDGIEFVSNIRRLKPVLEFQIRGF